MTGIATRIGIISSHQLMRDGIMSSLRESDGAYEVVLTSESAVHTFTILESYHESKQPGIDVLLISVALPDIDGIELAARLNNRWKLIQSIVISDRMDAEEVERAVNKRVRGFVLTTEPVDTLIGAIDRVKAGESCYECGLPAEIIASYQRRNPSTRNLETAITPRQVQVLGLICEGKTEREIATELGISHNTVHVHKNNIMQALQIHSKVGLVKYAAQHNLITL